MSMSPERALCDVKCIDKFPSDTNTCFRKCIKKILVGYAIVVPKFDDILKKCESKNTPNGEKNSFGIAECFLKEMHNNGHSISVKNTTDEPAIRFGGRIVMNPKSGELGIAED
jgi:hypothetical protein